MGYQRVGTSRQAVEIQLCLHLQELKVLLCKHHGRDEVLADVSDGVCIHCGSFPRGNWKVDCIKGQTAEHHSLGQGWAICVWEKVDCIKGQTTEHHSLGQGWPICVWEKVDSSLTTAVSL